MWISDPARRRLSNREYEIALLVGDGLKDGIIAKRLGLSPSTVGTYVRKIRQRLKLNGRAELVAWVEARRSSAYREDDLRRGGDERSP